MTTKAYKLLAKMRNSKTGWKRKNLIQLYDSFGFLIRHGASHDIVSHPKYPNLRTTLPRHSDLAVVYFEKAIELVDRLLDYERANQDGATKES